MNWILIGGIAVVAVVIIYMLYRLTKGYIDIYNKFIYWRNRVERKFADIDVIMQQRVDMLTALGQVLRKYSIHEWKTLKDTIEARSRWTKDTPLNEKVQNSQEIENNFLKIQTVIEKYPKIKADSMYKHIMGDSNISNVERRLRETRLAYNRVVQDYNERVERFPRNIVAKIHKFQKADMLKLGHQINQGLQEQYKPKEILND